MTNTQLLLLQRLFFEESLELSFIPSPFSSTTIKYSDTLKVRNSVLTSSEIILAISVYILVG